MLVFDKKFLLNRAMKDEPRASLLRRAGMSHCPHCHFIIFFSSPKNKQMVRVAAAESSQR